MPGGTGTGGLLPPSHLPCFTTRGRCTTPPACLPPSPLPAAPSSLPPRCTTQTLRRSPLDGRAVRWGRQRGSRPAAGATHCCSSGTRHRRCWCLGPRRGVRGVRGMDGGGRFIGLVGSAGYVCRWGRGLIDNAACVPLPMPSVHVVGARGCARVCGKAGGAVAPVAVHSCAWHVPWHMAWQQAPCSHTGCCKRTCAACKRPAHAHHTVHQPPQFTAHD